MKAENQTAFVTETTSSTIRTPATFRNDERRAMWVLGGAVVLATVLRLALVSRVYPLFLDPTDNYNTFGYEMGHVAYAIMTGHGFANPYWGPIGLSAKVPPVYVYFMVLAFKLFGIYTKNAAIFLLSAGSILSALTCIPIYFVGKQLTGARPALLAAWLWAIFPPSFYYASDRMWYFSLATLLLMLLIWAAFALAGSTNIWAWAGAGALAGFAVLSNPVILTVLPILGIFAVYHLQKNNKRWIMPAGYCAAVFLATVAPWLIRNYEVFHKFVFIRDDFWLELKVGNVGNWYYRWNAAIHPGINPAEMQEYVRMGELPYMESKKREVVDYIKANPGVFVTRTIRRFIYVWTGFWNFRSEYSSALLSGLMIACYSCFTLLSLAGLWRVYQARPDHAIFLGSILLLFPGVYYITHIELSYRHPIDPLCIILTSYALLSLRERAAQPRTDPVRPNVAVQDMVIEEAT
jgi:4-amino-4-deoxy-L-arabinose transferase-like glycosyltransferase